MLATLLGITSLAISLIGARPGTALGATTIEARVSASANDAEESATGTVSLTSTVLDLVYNAGNQTVGMRWTGLRIPNGATITAAYIQFYSSQAQSGAASLTLQGQAADNPPAFGTSARNISSRPRTTAATAWSPPAWAAGQVNTNERTPDMSLVIQEIAGRPGWVSGNALAIIVTGTGTRAAYSCDGKRARAPLLHVEYVPPDFPPVANLTVTQVATPALTVTASGAGSTDTDVTPIASYQFDFGDGSPVVVTTAPTATAQHSYATPGTYTVTLTVTDSGGLTSAPVTRSITVRPDNPPVASLTATQLSSPALTASASGAGSTDADLTPIASYHFDFGDGTPVVNTTAPTATAQHSYAAPGAYTVTLTVTDTGGLTSAPVTTSITINPPSDAPPVASLSVSQIAVPPLTVTADASGSTDADATPIASYHFDFGDGSAVVHTTAPTATAQHTYAVAATYTVTLTATDSGGLTSAPVTAPVHVTDASGALVAVYAGYYDTHHAVNPQPKPDPWRGSPNTVFVGQPDNKSGDPPGGGWDTSCMRVDNLTTAPISVAVTVDIGTSHYDRWGTNTIPAGYHLVLAQTAFENFDVPDKYPAGCYGCDPNLCLTKRSSEIPILHVTVAGTTTDYADTAQTLNTDGYDAAGCPYVGGPLPQTRYDESRNWVQVYPATSGASRASAAAAGADPPVLESRPRTLALASLSPNPARGDLAVRFSTPGRGPVHIGVYDLSGRLVRPCMNGVLEGGDYSLQVALGELPAGMYFVRLWTPQGSRHEKLVLMR